MDGSHFDALTRSLTEPRSRRGLTRLLGGIALGAPLALRDLSEVEARRRRGKCKSGKRRCKGSGRNFSCCRASETCCNGFCCPPGEECGPDRRCRITCTPGKRCEGSGGDFSCCPVGQHCCGPLCCPTGEVCGSDLQCEIA